MQRIDLHSTLSGAVFGPRKPLAASLEQCCVVKHCTQVEFLAKHAARRGLMLLQWLSRPHCLQRLAPATSTQNLRLPMSGLLLQCLSQKHCCARHLPCKQNGCSGDTLLHCTSAVQLALHLPAMQ